MVANVDEDMHPWRLVVRDPTVLVYILREWLADEPMGVIVYELWLRGMQYSLYRPACSVSTQVVPVPRRIHRLRSWYALRHLPGEAEFEVYMQSLKTFFRQPRCLRAATQYGGIICRILGHTVHEDDTLVGGREEFLDGPSFWARSDGGAPRTFVDEEGMQEEYWEEVLSEEELLYICGTYAVELDSVY